MTKLAMSVTDAPSEAFVFVQAHDFAWPTCHWMPQLSHAHPHAIYGYAYLRAVLIQQHRISDPSLN